MSITRFAGTAVAAVVSISIGVLVALGTAGGDQRLAIGQRVAPPPRHPDFVPYSWLQPGWVVLDSCLIPPTAKDVTRTTVAARGQRVFESGGTRIYHRADGTCVNLTGEPGKELPDEVADKIADAVDVGRE